MAAKQCCVQKYFLSIQVLLIQKCVLLLYQFITFSSLQSNSRELGKGLEVFPKKSSVLIAGDEECHQKAAGNLCY